MTDGGWTGEEWMKDELRQLNQGRMRAAGTRRRRLRKDADEDDDIGRMGSWGPGGGGRERRVWGCEFNREQQGS